jgi:hypothetical protein
LAGSDSPGSQFPDGPEYTYFNNYIIKVNPTGLAPVFYVASSLFDQNKHILIIIISKILRLTLLDWHWFSR